MSLPALFFPALSQIQAKWPTLSPEAQDRMRANLPSLGERHTFLDWNARVAATTTEQRVRDGCQAAYEAVMGWENLSDMERVAVSMAAIEPISKLAARMGLVGGIPAGTVA